MRYEVILSVDSDIPSLRETVIDTEAIESTSTRPFSSSLVAILKCTVTVGQT